MSSTVILPIETPDTTSEANEARLAVYRELMEQIYEDPQRVLAKTARGFRFDPVARTALIAALRDSGADYAFV